MEKCKHWNYCMLDADLHKSAKCRGKDLQCNIIPKPAKAKRIEVSAQEKRIRFLEATLSSILWRGLNVWGQEMPLAFDKQCAKQYKLKGAKP